jgi:BirA family transcriptional regulator, biotin operon repressor / biotin---[acetyl-CoA-carboxylase] ligase
MTAPPRLPAFYRLVTFDAIDSTNEEAKRRAREGAAEGLLVWAREQLAGRGRRGRSFSSPPGNLYLSVLLRPERPAVEAAQLSFAAALAVGEAAVALLPEPARLRYKWPNDVLIDGRKLSGVLLESQASSEGRLDWLVIGMGVNLASHPDGLEFPAISLKAAGAAVTVEGLLVAVAERFLFWYEHWRLAGFASLRDPWLARAQGLGGEIRVRLQAGELLGRFAGLDEEGALLFEDAAGRRRIAAGDIFPLGR